MKQLSLQEPGVFSWKEILKPERSEGEALVKVHRVGVCGTDLHAYAGKQAIFSYPRVLGHELAVEVLEVSENAKIRVGDLCTVEAYYPCYKCPACQSGKTNCCSNLQVLGVHTDGGHCPVMAIPTDKLHLGNGLSTDELALVEPLVIGAHSVERGGVKAGEKTLIMGAGTIGLAAALFARAEGGDVVLVDLNQERLNFAKEKLGFEKVSLGGEGLEGRLKEHFDTKSPVVIIDATGNKHSMQACIDLAEQGGRIVFVGFFPGELSFDDPTFHKKELSLMASRAGKASSFEKVISMMQSGKVDAKPMISHRLNFETLDKEFVKLAGKENLIKAIIHLND